MRQTVGWYRNAAEKKALYRQVYTTGKSYIEDYIKKHHPAEHEWGVILDIDETVLDNTWYFAECGALVAKEAEFSHYIALENRSTALPGASQFTNWVHEHGGYVTFVSNRDGSFKNHKGSVMDVTIANLKSEKIYFDQVILGNYAQAEDPKNKSPRFNAVEKGICDKALMVCSNTLPEHKIIAFFGDNIQDFPGMSQKELQNVNGNAANFDKFSQGYFVLPNPIYGSWQKLLKDN